MPYMTLSDDLPVWYQDEGEGRPIVLLQALMGTASYFWQHNRPLAKTNRLISYDLRGHGLTGKPLGGYTIRQCAHDLNEVLTRLELEDVTVGCFALGAMVALEYLRIYGPARLSKLIIIETQVRLTNAPGWDHPYLGNFTAEDAEGFVQACQPNRQLLKGFLEGAFNQKPQPDVMERLEAETWLTPTSVVIDYVREMVAADYREDISRIPLPTLFVYGRKNNNTLPTELGRWMHEQLPGSTLLEYQNSAHHPYWEEADRFNEDVAKFVNG